MNKKTCKKCGKTGHIDRFCFTDFVISGFIITENQSSKNTINKKFNKQFSCFF